jgi:hypothetical protein
MIKAVGGIFSVGGLAALIYFLVHYMHHSGSVSVGGTQLAHKSGGSIWPMVISGIVMIIGIIILVSSGNKE